MIKSIEANKKLIFYVDTDILTIKSGREALIIKDKLLHENISLISAVFKSSEIEKVSLDIKESSKILDTLGIEIKSPVFDVSIIAYLLNPSWEEYSFYKIAINYLESGLKLASLLSQTELDEKSEYKKQALYCDILDSAYDILVKKVKESNLDKLYYEIEEPLIFILRNMEKVGIAVDKHYLKELLNDYKIKIDELSNDIYKISAKTFNINSTKQLREILFKQLNLKPLKKGKTGPSTDEESLKKLAKMHPLPDLILKYRELSKIKGTYLEGLLKVIDSKDKKIHTTFNQTITQTGRLSSSNPNLQTIPIRSELGRQIRKAFIPANKKNLLLSADYSQIELRILAHLSGDENLINAFKEGKDIHRHTAATIFKINENIVSKRMRNIAKTVNFGIIYGISAYGLAKQLEISINEANDFIDNYFILYPGVKKYITRTIIQAREKKYVSTLLNRIRYLPEINSDDTSVREFGERLAVNTPIQGTSADLIKKAMVEIDKSVTKESVNATLLLQIHDELLFEVEAKKNDLIKKIITDKMISILTLDIPLEINIKTGSNWLELQKED